jgi:hypothetical protein
VVLRDCTVENIGVLARSYSPAVGLGGVGNEVSHCVLRHGPHNAILFHGNDHVISDNIIEDFVRDTDDAGAIYTGQDWSERGSIIKNNFIKDIGRPGAHYGANAIYLDDQASGIEVTGNIIVNAPRGILVGGGRDVLISDNVFARCGEGILVDARGTRDVLAYGAAANQRYKQIFAATVGDGVLYKQHYPAIFAQNGALLGIAGNISLSNNAFSVGDTNIVLKHPASDAVTSVATRDLRAFPLAGLAAPMSRSDVVALRERLRAEVTSESSQRAAER